MSFLTHAEELRDLRHQRNDAVTHRVQAGVIECPFAGLLSEAVASFSFGDNKAAGD